MKDALGRLDGIHTITVDLQSNRVTIVPDVNVELDLARIPAVIHAAGFRPSDLHVRAFGRAEGAEHALFRVHGWTRLYTIAPPLADDAEHTLEADVDTSGAAPVFVRWTLANP